jgi:hypothetical protein
VRFCFPMSIWWDVRAFVRGIARIPLSGLGTILSSNGRPATSILSILSTITPPGFRQEVPEDLTGLLWGAGAIIVLKLISFATAIHLALGG